MTWCQWREVELEGPVWKTDSQNLLSRSFNGSDRSTFTNTKSINNTTPTKTTASDEALRIRTRDLSIDTVRACVRASQRGNKPCIWCSPPSSRMPYGHRQYTAEESSTPACMPALIELCLSLIRRDDVPVSQSITSNDGSLCVDGNRVVDPPVTRTSSASSVGNDAGPTRPNNAAAETTDEWR